MSVLEEKDGPEESVMMTQASEKDKIDDVSEGPEINK